MTAASDPLDRAYAAHQTDAVTLPRDTVAQLRRHLDRLRDTLPPVCDGSQLGFLSGHFAGVLDHHLHQQQETPCPPTD